MNVAVPVTVPRLGWSMDEGTFVEWLKRDGEDVRVGEPLFVLESEKAAENIEAIDAGVLRIGPDAPQPGATVRVGQVLAYLAAAGEAMPSTTQATHPASQRAVARPESATGVTQATPFADSGRATHAVSPRARRVARELGIDWSTLHGSGAGGRVRERDVRAAATTAAATTAAAGRLVPHTHVRKLIATRMVAGVTQAAPVTLTTRADATELVARRAKLKSEAIEGTAPTYTDLLVKLAATALKQHPQLRSQWREDALFVPDAVHIAVAVDTNAGLVAPVMRDADGMNVTQIATRLRELTHLARNGRLGAEQMRDATFTITNLGMFGIDAFTPIIHLPQCAILGVGRIVREPAVVDDAIVPRDMITLSLTFDHRAVDGAPAARFLDALRRSIELPGPLLD
jgi:pyruvate dehydrogenase E2 component (dihydrolipoamide acetyltransferase)